MDMKAQWQGWAQQIAALPKGDHLFEIFLAKNAYLHGIRYLFAG